MNSDNLPHIYYATYRFGHHHAVSGYDRLGDFITSTKIVTPRVIAYVLKKLADEKRRSWLVTTTGLMGYFPECVWLEFWTGLISKIPMNSILHFIYPENSYYFTSGYKKSAKCKIVCSYHQPVEQSKQFILKTDPIRKLDGVILLSESQREFYEPLVGRENIYIVHYGIDLDRFPVSSQSRDPKRIVAVGNWLRDFPTFVKALEVLEKEDPDIICDVVTLESNRHYFANSRNVEFHCGISHEKLLSIYGRAALSVLTYTNAAASGALLESLASALPIVATDLPSIREYTNSNGCEYIKPFDGVRLAESILSLLKNEQQLAAMGSCNREHARNYSWENVAKKTMAVYNAISAR